MADAAILAVVECRHHVLPLIRSDFSDDDRSSTTRDSKASTALVVSHRDTSIPTGIVNGHEAIKLELFGHIDPATKSHPRQFGRIGIDWDICRPTGIRIAVRIIDAERLSAKSIGEAQLIRILRGNRRIAIP